MLLFATLGLLSFWFNLRPSGAFRWPAGAYGIPKPTSGCPEDDGFQWQEGWRSQDTNGVNSNNSRSPEYHLDGKVDNTKVQRSFCIKNDTTNDRNRPSWPPGKYCIYKKNQQCPFEMKKGFVYWDDLDGEKNSNDKDGTLPNGTYDCNTRIEFCCRTDGNKDNPILLPSERPFFLLAYESPKCQMVKWVTASPEWIYYDTEEERNADDRGGAFPYHAGVKHPTIYYCYYQGCNKTLTGLNGTFHSPNYPNKYSDGQYCSWRITVSPAQQIHLTFTDFNLQNENNTDALYVFDGENSTGEVLGVFYGSYSPPKEGTNSSSNHMFIIFKSDNNGSYTGFNASYSAVNYSAPTAAPKTTRVPEVTPSRKVKPKPSGRTTVIVESSSKSGGKTDYTKKSKEEGKDLLAIIVPVVALSLILAFLVAGLLYWKRKRAQENEQAAPKLLFYSSSTPSLNRIG